MESIFKAEKKVPVVERVIEQLRGAICSGKLECGARLLETEIADAMQISRNAVREAFRYLEKEGFITITPFKGAHVTVHTNEEISQMFEVMSGLEGMCVRLAIQKMTYEDLEKLEKLHTDLEQYYSADKPEKYLKANWKFHKAVRKIAGNDVLNKIYHDLIQKISLYRKKQLYRPNRFKASMEEHRLIIDAFRKEDPNLGEVRTREHLIRQIESLI